jgi:hypothetical protein
MVATISREPIDRIREEYLEMPGLALTCLQACKLWAVDQRTCQRLLGELIREGFLQQNDEGLFVRRTLGGR